MNRKLFSTKLQINKYKIFMRASSLLCLCLLFYCFSSAQNSSPVNQKLKDRFSRFFNENAKNQNFLPKEFEGITVYYSPKTVFEGDLKVTISKNNYTTIYSNIDVLGDGSPIEIVFRGNIVRSKNSYFFIGEWKNQIEKFKIDFLSDDSQDLILFSGLENNKNTYLKIYDPFGDSEVSNNDQEVDQKELDPQYKMNLASADSLFNLSEFSKAIDQYKFCINKFGENNYLTNRINASQISFFNQLKDSSNYYSIKEDYTKAMDFLLRAKKIGVKTEEANLGISNITTLINNKRINLLLDSARNNYYDKKYNQALKNFSDVLIYDPENKEAKEKIRNINETLTVLANRGSYFYDYSVTNPKDYAVLTESISEHFNKYISSNDKGAIETVFTIEFDTLSNNKSEINQYSTSINFEKSELEKIIKSTRIAPSSKLNYFVSSKNEFKIKANWNSRDLTIINRGKSNGYENTTDPAIAPINSFINNLPYSYGKFTFSVKDKFINEDKYSDISFKSYKSNSGSASFLYSMLLPGWGTLKVSHGKKGTGRLILYTLTAGLSILSKISSDNNYTKYLNTTNVSAANSLYNKANTSNKISLISGAIATSVYFYDIIWVIRKGSSNAKKARQNKQYLNSPNNIISSQKIKI